MREKKKRLKRKRERRQRRNKPNLKKKVRSKRRRREKIRSPSIRKNKRSSLNTRRRTRNIELKASLKNLWIRFGSQKENLKSKLIIVRTATQITRSQLILISLLLWSNNNQKSHLRSNMWIKRPMMTIMMKKMTVMNCWGRQLMLIWIKLILDSILLDKLQIKKLLNKLRVLRRNRNTSKFMSKSSKITTNPLPPSLKLIPRALPSSKPKNLLASPHFNKFLFKLPKCNKYPLSNSATNSQWPNQIKALIGLQNSSRWCSNNSSGSNNSFSNTNTNSSCSSNSFKPRPKELPLASQCKLQSSQSCSHPQWLRCLHMACLVHTSNSPTTLLCSSLLRRMVGKRGINRVRIEKW